MSKKAQHAQNVIDYYDGTRVEYRLLWRNRHNLGLHFGYYDDRHKTHDEAVLNLNAQLAKKIHMQKNDIVLDSGCGVGGSAIWIAKNIGALVTGINITPRQVERAKQNAHNANIDSKTDFIVADYADIPLDSNSFSVYWSIEAVVHALNKKKVLQEAHRILKPGGRLIIAEYVLKDSALSAEENQLLQEWLSGWSMPRLETEASYMQILQEAGFTDIVIEDWTEHMMPSLQRLSRFATVFKYIAPVLSFFRVANKNQRRNLSATLAQMKLLKKQTWHYKVITAHKPK